MLVYYAGVDGTLANGTELFTSIVFTGLSTYDAVVGTDIIGTATITTANLTTTGVDVIFDVPDDNFGSVMVYLLGGANGGNPQITITP